MFNKMLIHDNKRRMWLIFHIVSDWNYFIEIITDNCREKRELITNNNCIINIETYNKVSSSSWNWSDLKNFASGQIIRNTLVHFN